MMMPNPSQQRELWQARLDRFRAGTAHAAAEWPPGRGPETNRTGDASALRVQVGHALINLGSWLSGERVERARRAQHRTA